MQPTKLYIFSFSLVICFVVSISLALASTLLRSDQDISKRLDVVKNILSVSGSTEEQIKALESQGAQEVTKFFREQFQVHLIDHGNQEVELAWIKTELQKLGFQSEELEKKEAFELIDIFRSKLKLLASLAGKSVVDYDPGLSLVFLHQPEDKVVSYIVPVKGYGLWGLIYGYVALQPDLITIKDIRFYKHQETPGLGGECSQPWFTNQFKGKKILNSKDTFVSVTVVKGKASDFYSGEKLNHYVDGISGGTITTKGITKFLKKDLLRYNKYFDKLRKKGNS